LAFDKDDNLYLADLKKNRVLRVSPQNTVTLVAGNGSEGFSGDGGPATAARLNSPTALAVDQNGNVYISDSGNNTIRKVTPDGLISSLTGAQLNAFTGDDGPAKLAHLSDPRGIALDSAGNLYIADSGNNRVRKISATSQIISTIAGSGVDGFGGDGDLATHALLDFPTDIAVDSSGNVYVVDSGNHRLRNLTPLKTQTKP